MAAGGTPSQVTLGAGRLYVAPIGTAEPTNGSTAMPSAWWSIGYTEEGSAFSNELTSEAVEVAEEIDPIRYVLSRRASTLALAMAQTTKKRLGLALGTGAGLTDDAASYEPPDPGAEVAVIMVWDNLDTPSAANYRYIFRQVKPSGTIEMANRKAPQKRLIGVTFNLEKPDGLAPWKVFPSSTGIV